MEEDIKVVNLTPQTISDYGVCGYKDVEKHVELRNKINWYKEYYPKGLRINAIISKTGGYQGMIEYIPGEFAHRPVSAKNYLFIHCLFVGFKNEFKGKGLATMLINDCIEQAKQNGFDGVATVTRKGSFMAKKQIYEKLGFTLVDKAQPDFELMVKKFEEKSKNPNFIKIEENLKKYQNGLFVFRSSQCPYTEKNVNAILQSAKQKYNITPNLVNLKTHIDAQNTPSPFGTFCIVYNGKVLTHSPISNTRFENIMEEIK